MAQRRRRTAQGGIAGLVLAITACASNGTPNATVVSVTPAPVTTVGPDDTVTLETAPEVDPTGTAEQQLEWYINVLNGTAELNETTYQQRFTAELQEELPFEQFNGLTNQLSTVAPVTIDSTTPVPLSSIDTETASVDVVEAAMVSSTGAGFLVLIGVDDSGRISQIDVEGDDDPTLDTTPEDLSAAASDINDYGDVQYVAASIDLDALRFEDVNCETIEGDDPDAATAVGAASAIWVLGALADAIAAGELNWETELTITDASKSLDPGVLNERPDLSPVSVQNAATYMFELSDNTAYDLLVSTLGRDAVEAAQSRWGNQQAELNSPFLTTREMFVLKTSTADVQDAYLAASPQERRDMLPELSSVPAADIPVDVFSQGPIRPDTLNWFASPSDLCTGLARLMWTGTNVDGLGEIVNIITSNHGGTPDAQWDEIAFKGGSEPGMLTMAWVMAADVETPEGESIPEWSGYVGNVVNNVDDFADAEPTLLLAASRDLLGPPLEDDETTEPDDAGNDDAGNDDTGNDDAGNDDVGNDNGGNGDDQASSDR